MGDCALMILIIIYENLIIKSKVFKFKATIKISKAKSSDEIITQGF